MGIKKRTLLQERFQQLAGIKPLYQLKEQLISFEGLELPECIQDPQFMYYLAFTSQEYVHHGTAVAVCESGTHTTADTFTQASCNEILDIETADLTTDPGPPPSDDDEEEVSDLEASDFEDEDEIDTDTDTDQGSCTGNPHEVCDPNCPMYDCWACQEQFQSDLDCGTEAPEDDPRNRRASVEDEWWGDLSNSQKKDIMKKSKKKTER